MKTYVKVVYGIALTLSCIMIALFYICERSVTYNTRGSKGYSLIKEYEKVSYEADDAPAGIVQEYRWIPKNIKDTAEVVAFYLIHQEVEVYVGDNIIYSITRSDDNKFSKTPGCDWAKIYLSPEDAGKEIRIVVYPVYESSIEKELTIYYGDNSMICRKIVVDSLLVLILGLLAIVIGIAFIVFRLVNYKNPELNNDIAIIGVFALATGLWKVADTEAAPLLFNESVGLSAIAIISISVMLTSYVMYIRNQIAVESHRFWNILSVLTALSCIVIVVLQLTNIADLRPTLVFCHIMTVITMGLILYMLLRDIMLHKNYFRLKMTVFCCLLCLVGCFVDLIVYYYSGNSGKMIYGIFAFLIYIVSMGYASLKDAITLIEKGKKARFYESLAMHDELSGLYNRAYYARYLENHDLKRSDAFIIMFDVNDLKRCNDTYGHDCGDKLIKNTAKLIEEAFLPEGVCIRNGGDEFCVIVPYSNEAYVKQRLKKLEGLLNEFNTVHKDEYPVRIAYGYANYSKEKDYDLSDTMRRADKNMYRMKTVMKRV